MAVDSLDWKDALERAARRARADVFGVKRITEVQHGLLVTTALNAFGDDPKATFFIEGLAESGNIPRPDLILLHPDVGVIVIENKGVKLSDIHAVNNTSLTLARNGRLKDEDPYQQSEKVMFRLRDLSAARVDLSEALFLNTAALPRVDRDEFDRRFGTRWPDQTLFADACADPAKFKAHLIGFSDFRQRAARRSSKLSKRARDAVMLILNGRGFLFAPRKTYIEDADPNLIGAQVQEMELALKHATDQQKELGRADLRGHHRLFRGVAGSGKSIMLALSVGHTLLKYREEGAGLFDKPSRKRRVLVVCFNKTLVPFLRQRIEDRYGRLAWDMPDPEAVVVTHFEGLVRQLELKSPALVTGLDWNQKEERAKGVAKAFEGLAEAARHELQFDAVYVDEAQDLTPEEIRLLLRLTRQDDGGGQTFVLFYDNAQNIYGVKPPVWHDLGVNIVGRTVFLDQCLRNTRQTLNFAFNVLVGTFAPEGQRVATKQFADVQSLRQRELIDEVGGRVEVKFSPRTGPSPSVTVYPSRTAEIDGTVDAVRKLVTEQRVIPSDILILYVSHWPYKDGFVEKLQQAVGPRCRVRPVDKEHEANKKLPLIEDGVLTVSTIASAKGYDAPVVFLLGADELGVRVEDRASFYVGATRAKLQLLVSGMKKSEPTLLDEIAETATTFDPASVKTNPRSPSKAKPSVASRGDSADAATAVGGSNASTAPTAASKGRCRHCGSDKVHAQYGKFSYFYRCIDCTRNTPIEATCPNCLKSGRIRKAGNHFFRECGACGYSAVFHTNVPLSSL